MPRGIGKGHFGEFPIIRGLNEKELPRLNDQRCSDILQNMSGHYLENTAHKLQKDS